MIELVKQLQSEGYKVNDVVADGKLHRFSLDKDDAKESGYYVAFQNFTRKSGKPFYVMLYGSWRSSEQSTFNTITEDLSKDDKIDIKKKIEEARKKEEAHRKAHQEKTAVEVEAKWEKLATHGQSDYLSRKQISGPDLGIRFDGSDAYVPMRDLSGKLWSWQKIQWDGQKFFHSGGRVSGCFHTIGDIGHTVLVAEGFATAASIHLATGLGVVVAFNAGNLLAVSSDFKTRYPDRSFILCGDNDLWATRGDGTPFNPGRDKAEEAAKRVLGSCIFPRFSSLDSRPTDFNDLHVAEGLEEVNRQIIGVKVERVAVTALGFKEDEYFFTSSQNQQIVKISAKGFSDGAFCNLMTKDYWEMAFPGRGEAKVDWLAAKSHMMIQCRKKGIFESKRVRGAGVWQDDGRVVVNMGDHLIVNGEPCALDEFKSRYFYTLGIKMPPLHPKPLTVTECGTLVSVCEQFKWKQEDFGFLLAGALVTTRVCGALPIRPHTWIVGEKGSGKTTLMNRLIFPMIGDPLLFLAGNSTEAGIRQEVSANAVPVLFDEFENNGQKSSDIIQSVIDLMRVSWSETNAVILKGGSDGTATSYQARFAAIVTSIRQVSLSDADQSRFATIELAPHGDDQAHWERLDALLNQVDLEFGNRLFARTISLLPVLLQNYKTMKSALNRQTPGQRFGDQYGMLLAGYALLLQDEPVNDTQADVLARHVKLRDAREQAKVADQDSALDKLLTKKVSLEIDGERHEYAVSEAIHDARFQVDLNEALQRLGIKVESEFVAIASTHTELESQIYRDTKWSNTWAATLRRIDGAVSNQSVWMAKKNQKCVKIPFSVFTAKS